MFLGMLLMEINTNVITGSLKAAPGSGACWDSDHGTAPHLPRTERNGNKGFKRGNPDQKAKNVHGEEMGEKLDGIIQMEKPGRAALP